MLESTKQHLADFSAGKWDAYKAAFATNVVYEEIATRQRIQGADQYVSYVQRWKRAFPDLKAKVLGGVEVGDEVYADVEWEGTQTGPLDGPFGTIPPTNRKGTLRAIIMAKRDRDGKIVETRHFFDMLGLLMQLGVMPVAQAPAPEMGKPAVPPSRH